MASTRTLAKSINMSFLQNNNKIIYVLSSTYKCNFLGADNKQ